MFRKLHRQMTCFCTLIVSLLLIALTLFCLFISERNLRAGAEISFLRELNTVISYLQSQTVVSFQWRARLQEDNDLLLFFYDNDRPLYSQQLSSDSAACALAERAKQYAEDALDIRFTATSFRSLPAHTEFTLTSDGADYYASVGILSRGTGTLGFVILAPQERLSSQIASQRLLFACLDLAALLFLTLFIWRFTGSMLKPLAENQQKQLAFVSLASHELRAPLTVMLSGADAVRRAQTDADRRYFLDIVRAEGNRMQRLIQDLLFLARSGQGAFSIRTGPCQPELLLMDAYETFELPAHQKKQSLSLQLTEDSLPSVHCDAERIAQVFAILLDNAMSYSPEGGQILLTLKRRGMHVCFSVTDQGPGIPDSEKERIFDRFYRADASHSDREHFGLGLCIAREIIAAHRGRLWVTDAPGGGASFHFTLPLH